MAERNRGRLRDHFDESAPHRRGQDGLDSLNRCAKRRPSEVALELGAVLIFAELLTGFDIGDDRLDRTGFGHELTARRREPE